MKIVKTEILKKSEEAFKKSKEIIQNGGLVAFGTETVYGLGADAFNANAVKSIFEVKGRPGDNPLIVHLPDVESISKVALITPTILEKLKSIMPSPLTVVLPKVKELPYEVTAGLETVAVRIPALSQTREFLSYCGTPIAAPSANTSTRPSPTAAAHVFEDLNGKIPLILDFGQSVIGLESTVLDLTSSPYRILRAGGFTLEMLKECFNGNVTENAVSGDVPKSPGMKYKHYSPKVPVRLYKLNEIEKLRTDIANEAKTKKPALMAMSEYKELIKNNDGIVFYDLGCNKESAAAKLFDALRDLEKRCDCIFTLEMEEGGIGAAFNNRINKASS